MQINHFILGSVGAVLLLIAVFGGKYSKNLEIPNGGRSAKMFVIALLASLLFSLAFTENFEILGFASLAALGFIFGTHAAHHNSTVGLLSLLGGAFIIFATLLRWAEEFGMPI